MLVDTSHQSPVTSIESKYEIEMLTSPFNLSEMQMLPDVTTICTNEWHLPRILFSFACDHHYQIKIMHFVCKWNRMRSNEIKTISAERVRGRVCECFHNFMTDGGNSRCVNGTHIVHMFMELDWTGGHKSIWKNIFNFVVSEAIKIQGKHQTWSSVHMTERRNTTIIIN